MFKSFDMQFYYVSIFGRPADPEGLVWWDIATLDGQNLEPLKNLTATPEYLERFDGFSNGEVVNSIYKSLFNRGADEVGLEFFTNALETGEQSIDTIAFHIASGALGDDATTLVSKLAAANSFTRQRDTPVEVGAYAGPVASEVGVDYLASVGAGNTPTPDEVAVVIQQLVSVDFF